MATIKEKMQSQTSAKPHKVMETDHENINLSRDQFVLKYRKKAEIEAKLELQRKELEAQAEAELNALETAGNEDNKANEQKTTNEEV